MNTSNNIYAFFPVYTFLFAYLLACAKDLSLLAGEIFAAKYTLSTLIPHNKPWKSYGQPTTLFVEETVSKKKHINGEVSP